MSPDDINFFDIGETTGGEVRFRIVTIAEVIFITDGNTIKVMLATYLKI